MTGSSTTDWAAHAIRTLCAAGHRRGGALLSVVALLDRDDAVRSADELVAALRAAGGRAGRTSVYRVLDLLVSHDLVERVEVADAAARYEVRRGPRRHHMVCRACGGVMRFDDAQWSAAITELSTRLGATIDERHTLLQGECLRCADAAAAAACRRCG